MKQPRKLRACLSSRLPNSRNTIANSRIIDGSKIDTDRIQVLNKVKIRNTKNTRHMEYTIVPDSEADLKQGKIALSTPIARGLLGREWVIKLRSRCHQA
jgi:transcription elongation factor GreA